MSKRKRTQQSRVIGISLAGVALVAVAAAIVLLVGPGPAAPPASTATPAAAINLGSLNQLDQITAVPTPTPTMGEIMTFFADDDPYLGPQDAPVVIVEFSDYLCPYCGSFTLETLPRILDAYPDQVRFIHRDAPILDQETSVRAAIAAGCAEEQGQFWAMHDLLFGLYENFDADALHEARARQDQAMLATHLHHFSEERLRGMAAQLGLELDAYDACMAGDERSTEVVIDLQTALQLGVRSVPAYIVNGQMVSGARPFAEFARIIDTALAERPIAG